MSQVILKSVTAQQNQGAMSHEILKQITAAPNQAAISNEIINTFKAQQNQSQIQGVMVNQLMSPPAEQALMNIAKQQGLITQSQANANFVQGQDKIVTAQWEYSDGTGFFHVFNDSGSTLDFGGDFAGFPYSDMFPSGTTFGQLTGLEAADGTIAPGASADFQITPEPSTADKPSQLVPYRGEAHIQVTLPGHQLATLDLSASAIPGGVPPSSALLSGQAVVGGL
jgi:hypothetical protein